MLPVIFEFGMVSVMVLGVSVNGLNTLMVLSVLLVLKTLKVLKVLMMWDERLELEGNPGSTSKEMRDTKAGKKHCLIGCWNLIK